MQGKSGRPSQSALLAALRWIFEQPPAPVPQKAYSQSENENTPMQALE